MNFPAHQKVRDARQRYYEQNGIANDGGASEKIGRAAFGPITLYVPNFAARVATLQRHDLHHILLDADTTMKGEAIVGGFETGAGCGRFWVAWFLEPQTIVYGLVLNPRATFQAFLLGRRSKNFYHGPFREEWLNMTVGELRDTSLAKGKIFVTMQDLVSFIIWVIVGAFELTFSLAILLCPFIALFLFISAIV